MTKTTNEYLEAINTKLDKIINTLDRGYQSGNTYTVKRVTNHTIESDTKSDKVLTIPTRSTQSANHNRGSVQTVDMNTSKGSLTDKISTDEAFPARRQYHNVLEDSVEDKIAHDYAIGLPNRDILKKYDISSGKLYTIIHSKGIETKSGNSKVVDRINEMDAYTKDSILEDFLTGTPVDSIYLHYGINKNTLYTLLDLYNG